MKYEVRNDEVSPSDFRFLIFLKNGWLVDLGYCAWITNPHYLVEMEALRYSRHIA